MNMKMLTELAVKGEVRELELLSLEGVSTSRASSWIMSR